MKIKITRVIKQRIYSTRTIEDGPCCKLMAERANSPPHSWKFCAFCGTPIDFFMGEDIINTEEDLD